MPNYIAVIRLLDATKPQKLSFAAQGVTEAINEMVRGAKCASEADLAEFEILEVTDNGNAYRPVASKLERKRKEGTRLPVVFPPVNLIDKEPAYAGYKLSMAEG